jgi:hypothetical protein
VKLHHIYDDVQRRGLFWAARRGPGWRLCGRQLILSWLPKKASL